jgi:hypothetical protein
LIFWALVFALFLAGCSTGSDEQQNSPVRSSFTQWYVDPVLGDDNNNGESRETAFATLTRSVRAARSSTNKVQTILLLSSPLTDRESSVKVRSRGYDAASDDAVFDFSSLYDASDSALRQPELLIRGDVKGDSAPVELRGAEGKRVLNVGAGENLRLENVTITGGDTTKDGAAALVINGGRLALGDGVVVFCDPPSGFSAGSEGKAVTGRGRGIFCSAGELVLGGSVEFGPDNDIYLAGDETVTLESSLQKGSVSLTLASADGRFIFTAPKSTAQSLDALGLVIPQFALHYSDKDGATKTASSSAKGWFAFDGSPEPDTYYVDNKGDDTFTGYTVATAFRTLDAAFDAIRSGSPIRTVTVTEGLSRPAGAAREALWLAANLGSQEVLLRGHRTKPSDPSVALKGATGFRVLSVTGKTVLRIADLVITEGDARQGAGIYVDKDAEVILDGAIIDGNRGETGAGAYIAGKVTLSGAARFGDADLLFLESGRMVTVTGVLSADIAAALELVESTKAQKVLDGLEDDLEANHDKFIIHMKEQWTKAGVPALCPDAQGLVVTGADFYVWNEGDDKEVHTLDGRRIFRTLSAAVTAAREDALKDRKEKTLMVIGTLNEESENGSSSLNAPRDRVFVISPRSDGATSSDPLITITGWFSKGDPPRLSAQGTGKGVLSIEGANTAISFTNIAIIGGRAAVGAGLYVTEASVTLDKGAVLKDNAATDIGGAVYAQSANVTVNNAVIGGPGGDANSAKNGGGITVKSSILNLKGGRIEGNRGGAVFASESVTTMSGGTITGNIANNTGGGLYIRDGEFTLTGGTLAGNVALKGGAVYLESSNATVSSTFTMKGGDITRHSATAVFIDGYGNFILSGGTITRNGSAGAEGGGVALSGAKFTMTGGEISNNEAADGGGVWVQGFTPANAGDMVSALFD